MLILITLTSTGLFRLLAGVAYALFCLLLISTDEGVSVFPLCLSCDQCVMLCSPLMQFCYSYFSMWLLNILFLLQSIYTVVNYGSSINNLI